MKIKRIVVLIFALVMSFSAMTYAQQGTFFVSAASDSTVSVKTPTSFKASKNKEASIRLTWKKVSDASGYRVFKYNPSEKKWEKIKTLKDTECTVQKLTAGTVYKFRVKAYKKVDGKTLWSEATSTLKTATKPATPKNLTASSVSDNSITITWSKVKGATGYRVYKYNAETKKWEKIKTTTEKNYTVKGLEELTEYKFRVKAYKKVDNVILWGQATATFKAITEKYPNSKVVTKTDGGVKLYEITSDTAKKIKNSDSTFVRYPAYEGKSADGKTVVVYAKTTNGWYAIDVDGAWYNSSGEKKICEYCGKTKGSGNGMCDGCAVTIN